MTSFIPTFVTHVKTSQSDFAGKATYPESAKDMDEQTFYPLLYGYLCSFGSGPAYISSFEFRPELNCSNKVYSENSPRIIAMKFGYNHRNVESSMEQIKEMNSVKDIIDDFTDLGPDVRLFADSAQYSDLTTLEIITLELFRNICLAVVCIFFVTLLLLSDVVASLMVLGSVILTLVDVGGFMHFWGLTIDTVSSLLLTVSKTLGLIYFVSVTNSNNFQ